MVDIELKKPYYTVIRQEAAINNADITPRYGVNVTFTPSYISEPKLVFFLSPEEAKDFPIGANVFVILAKANW